MFHAPRWFSTFGCYIPHSIAIKYHLFLFLNSPWNFHFWCRIPIESSIFDGGFRIFPWNNIFSWVILNETNTFPTETTIFCWWIPHETIIIAGESWWIHWFAGFLRATPSHLFWDVIFLGHQPSVGMIRRQLRRLLGLRVHRGGVLPGMFGHAASRRLAVTVLEDVVFFAQI